MPKRIAEDQFRGILAGSAKEDLKKALESGTLFSSRNPSHGKVSVTIPRMTTPNFTWNGSQYSQDVEEKKPKKKPKLYRSIEEPFEPCW
jgi:hypothetical protein